MIQMLSKLKVADNTGAKEAKMIRRLGQLKRTAGVGDEIVVHIRDASPDSSIKKGTVCRAVIVPAGREAEVQRGGNVGQ